METDIKSFLYNKIKRVTETTIFNTEGAGLLKQVIQTVCAEIAIEHSIGQLTFRPDEIISAFQINAYFVIETINLTINELITERKVLIESETSSELDVLNLAEDVVALEGLVLPANHKSAEQVLEITKNCYSRISSETQELTPGQKDELSIAAMKKYTQSLINN